MTGLGVRFTKKKIVVSIPADEVLVNEFTRVHGFSSVDNFTAQERKLAVAVLRGFCKNYLPLVEIVDEEEAV